MTVRVGSRPQFDCDACVESGCGLPRITRDVPVFANTRSLRRLNAPMAVFRCCGYVFCGYASRAAPRGPTLFLPPRDRGCAPGRIGHGPRPHPGEIRPNAAGERIDLLSGNVNFSVQAAGAQTDYTYTYSTRPGGPPRRRPPTRRAAATIPPRPWTGWGAPPACKPVPLLRFPKWTRSMRRARVRRWAK